MHSVILPSPSFLTCFTWFTQTNLLAFQHQNHRQDPYHYCHHCPSPSLYWINCNLHPGNTELLTLTLDRYFFLETIHLPSLSKTILVMNYKPKRYYNGCLWQLWANLKHKAVEAQWLSWISSFFFCSWYYYVVYGPERTLEAWFSDCSWISWQI